MTRFLLVAMGGAVGSVARYSLSLAAARVLPGAAWPWATLAVNVIGGLAMGLLAGWLALRSGANQDNIRLFAAVGLLGGFTTFSAFSLDAALLWERGEAILAIAYVAGSVVLSIAALAGGLAIVRALA